MNDRDDLMIFSRALCEQQNVSISTYYWMCQQNVAELSNCLLTQTHANSGYRETVPDWRNLMMDLLLNKTVAFCF